VKALGRGTYANGTALRGSQNERQTPKRDLSQFPSLQHLHDRKRIIC
jgi:hypothetical protein